MVNYIALLCEDYNEKDEVLAEYLLIKRIKSKTAYPQFRPYFQINPCIFTVFNYSADNDADKIGAGCMLMCFRGG